MVTYLKIAKTVGQSLGIIELKNIKEFYRRLVKNIK
jgi:hypothetical protein